MESIWLFDTEGFPARWNCGAGWADEPLLGWAHIVSDVVIWAAYAAIPCVLAYFVLRRKDTVFPGIFWLFCAFIVSCGFVHLIEATIFWVPLYRLSGAMKVVTALVSAATVVALVRVLPFALALPGLAAVNAELERSRAALRTVLDSSRNLIGLMSPDGTLVDANRTALDVVGVSAGDVLGKPFWTTPWWSHSPELQERLREAVRTAASGKTDRFEATHQAPDGSLVKVDFTLTPVVSGDEVIFLVPEAEDVTERTLREAALERFSRRLQQSNKDLEEFAYVASHDLRSPLRAISLLTSFIEEDDAEHLTESGRERLEMIGQRVSRMDGLLQDLLSYSRLGNEASELALVDTGRLVDEVVELLDVPDGFSVTRAADMPVFETLQTPLRLVFLNLVSNALKHHGGQSGRVEIDATDVGDAFEMRVSDDGRGIPADDHQRIFHLFQTLRPKDEVEASGMGLAMVKKTIDRVGGSIRVDSGVGEGATIVFTWPKDLSAESESVPGEAG